MVDVNRILISKATKQIAYNICNKHHKHLAEDLQQEAILFILEKSAKLNMEFESEQNIYYLFSKCAWIIYNDKTSKSNFRARHTNTFLPITKEPEYVDEIENKIDEEASLKALELRLFSVSQSTDEEYNKGLFHCYLKYGSGYAVSTMTGIPVRTVYKDLADYKNELKIVYETANKK